jgi:hypothetical protein
MSGLFEARMSDISECGKKMAGPEMRLQGLIKSAAERGIHLADEVFTRNRTLEEHRHWRKDLRAARGKEQEQENKSGQVIKQYADMTNRHMESLKQGIGKWSRKECERFAEQTWAEMNELLEDTVRKESSDTMDAHEMIRNSQRINQEISKDLDSMEAILMGGREVRYQHGAQALERPTIKSMDHPESPIAVDSDTHELDLSVDSSLSESTVGQSPISPKRMYPEPSPEYQKYDPEATEPKSKRNQSTTKKKISVFQDVVETRVSDGVFGESRGTSVGTSRNEREEMITKWPINGPRAGEAASGAQ